jgi:hypothetical protein
MPNQQMTNNGQLILQNGMNEMTQQQMNAFHAQNGQQKMEVRLICVGPKYLEYRLTIAGYEWHAARSHGPADGRHGTVHAQSPDAERWRRRWQQTRSPGLPDATYAP